MRVDPQLLWTYSWLLWTESDSYSFHSETKQEREDAYLSISWAGTLTYHTERFPRKAQSSLPSSVPTAAPSRPDTNNKFQTKDNNHDKFLETAKKKNACYR